MSCKCEKVNRGPFVDFEDLALIVEGLALRKQLMANTAALAYVSISAESEQKECARLEALIQKVEGCISSGYNHVELKQRD